MSGTQRGRTRKKKRDRSMGRVMGDREKWRYILN